MSDREMVIQHFQDAVEASGKNNKWRFVRLDIIEKAISLLKEQEAKAGTWQWKIHGKPESGGTLGEAICDQCGKSTFATAVKGDLNYCPNCGAKMCKR